MDFIQLHRIDNNQVHPILVNVSNIVTVFIDTINGKCCISCIDGDCFDVSENYEEIRNLINKTGWVYTTGSISGVDCEKMS